MRELVGVVPGRARTKTTQPEATATRTLAESVIGLSEAEVIRRKGRIPVRFTSQQQTSQD